MPKEDAAFSFSCSVFFTEGAFTFKDKFPFSFWWVEENETFCPTKFVPVPNLYTLATTFCKESLIILHGYFKYILHRDGSFAVPTKLCQPEH
jgi:hypothetical protein